MAFGEIFNLPSETALWKVTRGYVTNDEPIINIVGDSLFNLTNLICKEFPHARILVYESNPKVVKSMLRHPSAGKARVILGEVPYISQPEDSDMAITKNLINFFWINLKN